MEIVTIKDKRFVIKGVGKLFYQEGLPLSVQLKYLQDKNINISLLHLADELLKNGWSPKTTYNKIREELYGFIDNKDLETIYEFCNKDYEDQRDMIFNNLFNNYDDAKTFFKNNC